MQLPNLYYLERYRNKGTRTYSSHSAYSEAQGSYQPESNCPQFDLHWFDMPREQVNIYTANPEPSLLAQYVTVNSARVCIHPQVLEQFADDPYLQFAQNSSLQQSTISVAPSSSTRTLFVLDSEQPHAVKVHFPFKVSRYTRKMRDEVIEQAIHVSRELEAGMTKMGDDFAFLREVIGISIKAQPDESERGENWGFLVRDMCPFPKVEQPRTLVPGFALYGEDFHHPGQTPLLIELIGSQEPVQYVLEKILKPIIRHWLDCFRHFGFLLEPHGQNVLLELDGAYQIKRIVHRDLSVGIDMRLRRLKGLPDGPLNHYNRMEQSAFHSICFDRFMGSHFFDRIIQTCLEHYPGVCESDFTQPCQALVAQYFPEYQAHFPNTVWYFSEARDQYNKPLYQNTGQAPKWRPNE